MATSDSHWPACIVQTCNRFHIPCCRFATCVKQDFITPLESHSESLVSDVEAYIIETFKNLLEVDGLSTRSPIPDMKMVPLHLRKVLLEEITDFVRMQELTCRETLATVIKSEEFIFTLDSMYGTTIEELKTSNEGDQSQWSLIKFITGVTEHFAEQFRDGNNDQKALCELQASLKVCPPCSLCCNLCAVVLHSAYMLFH